MNRAELIDALADRAQLSRRDATAVITHLFNPTDGIIGRARKKGDKVSLTGFGVFCLRKRAARTGRNPQTGESIKVAASKVPGFNGGVSLRATVSGKARGGADGGRGATKGAKTARKR